MNDNDLKIIEAMNAYGGSFVRSVANCARLADEWNLERLKTAFPEMWMEYTQLAVKLEEKKKQEANK